MIAWLGAFLFGQVIEVPLYALALRRRPLLLRLLIGFGASAITHPFVWFVFPRWIDDPYWLMALAAECFAVGVEAVYLRLFGVRRAIAWSLLANGASCGLGLLSRSLIGWP